MGVGILGSNEQVARAALTLRIEPAQWRRVLARYSELSPGPSASVEARLKALHAAFAADFPSASRLAGGAAVRACPACFDGSIAPLHARGGPSPLFVYGGCEGCGHGLLLSDPEPDGIYGTAAYYERRNESGAGYSGYEREGEYRVAKGSRLLRRITQLSGRPARSVLEIGSGYGFTRAAAAGRGLETLGIDPNPAAAAAAKRLFGMETFVGTLSSALDSGVVERGIWDIVLYDFVLEHLADPEAELRRAARLLSPAGVLALVVPNMAAAEVAVFGGYYRSFRSDHRHIFSPASLERLLGRAGLRLAAVHSGCTVHLLGGMLSEGELSQLYESGKGPDLTIVATMSGR
jgi:SAM-dependent methyltransferase